ncbi:MAG TPA: hypothetical protein VMV27_05525 [Candidatus Binataceae bacterium]|nr:hypothetical protein [Candidatus Binataceae bacterium]
MSSARSIDVSEEILDQHLDTAKMIAFLVAPDVTVVAFADLVVVPNHGASVR